jgi:hypothetical protein
MANGMSSAGNRYGRVLALVALIGGLAVAPTVTAAVPAGAVTSALTNGSFETGDFAGWTIAGPSTSVVVASWPGGTQGVDYAPQEGSKFAIVHADDATAPVTIEQTFSADAGAIISGSAFFQNLGGGDFAKIEILSATNVVVATPFFATGGQDGPWTPWTHTLIASGSYTFRGTVLAVNWTPLMGLDNVRLTAPPPMATSTALISSPTTSAYGNSVTFTASVCAPPGAVVPTGTVAFTAGALTLGSDTLVSAALGSGPCAGALGASASVSSAALPVGVNQTVTATYTPSGNFVGSSGTAMQTVTKRPITVTAAANSKGFDGNTSAAAVPMITSGSLVGLDLGGFSETYDTANIGTGKTLTPTGNVIDGNGGNNYAVIFVASTNGVIGCSQNINSSSTPVNVTGGSACVTGSIAGGITVSGGASLFLSNAMVTGPITTNGAGTVKICGTTVTGAVNITGSTGPVWVGGTGCAGNSIGGTLTLASNTAGLRVSDNSIGGAADIKNSTGAANVVRGNYFKAGLACTNDNPAPINEGSGNAVKGARSGQCASAAF